jgi:hypothetical protein
MFCPSYYLFGELKVPLRLVTQSYVPLTKGYRRRRKDKRRYSIDLKRFSLEEKMEHI